MKRVLILMSDTGGGHRAVSNAIRDALVRKHGDDVQIQIVDFFKDYTPAPFKYAPEIYPIWINHSKASWGMGYSLTNGKVRAQAVQRGAYITLQRRITQMLREHPADVIVCAHALIVGAALSALNTRSHRPPFVVVVTDLVSTHHFWYDRRADRILVPTKPALDRGLDAGIPATKMRITGLPVQPSFAERLQDKAEARRELGWDPDLPTVLIVGGGDGMGILYKVTRAINKRGLNMQFVIVTGRNKQLKAKLESQSWNQPTRIYPFVRNMPQLMAAADIIATKAGAASVCEATIAGLPMIIYEAIPGQETGNVEYIVENDAGIFAPSPSEVADTLTKWLAEGKERLAERAARSLALGRPEAVFEIADEVWGYAQQPRIATHRRGLRGTLEEIASNLTP